MTGGEEEQQQQQQQEEDVNGEEEKKDEYIVDGYSENAERSGCCDADSKEEVISKKTEETGNDGNGMDKEVVAEEKNGENGEEEEEELAREDVCRDFLNNMCNRGSRCKFYHPPSIIRQRASQQTPENIEYQFCIDYQNRGCHRDNCRYIHAHREDVDRYKMTGEVTLNLAREIAAVYNCDTINGIPFCKEYQTGTCSRGGQRCRYWHINVDEERERRRRISRGMQSSMLPPLSRGAGLGLPYGGGGGGGYGGRRSHLYGGGSGGGGADGYGAYGKRLRYELEDDYVRDLERRNAELSKEIEGLKRELTRERQRYEDLYVLFRQRTTTDAAAAASSPTITATTSQNFATTNTVPAATTAYYQAAAPPSTAWTDTQWTH